MKSDQTILHIMKELPELRFRENEPMKDHTSFKVGGSVSVMYFPKSTQELSRLSALLQEHAMRYMIIGNGTNLLVDDQPLDLAVIKTHDGLGELELTGETEITGGCGVLLSKLANFALEHGLTGAEFAHGIPGTLGGAVSMNAGAYGSEMKDIVTRTTYLRSGTLLCAHGEEHGFGYRHSRFSDTKDIILESVLCLKQGNPQEIKTRMEELATKRRDKQPLNMPSAGSTFKRPPNGFAGALIEEAGLKGFAIGGAMVSEKHSGFVVNRGGATYADVMAVVEHVRNEVFRQFGSELQLEIKTITNTGNA